ncbi:MAG TPA: sigma-70 family RNA polymerase sigma factor [Actinocrinis sp.]|nr:sigma-70 family RNA polymerase sigma factor [Actinocrinis sp.]
MFILVALAAVVALTALSSRRRGRREADGEVSGPRYAAEPTGAEAAAGPRPAPLRPPENQSSQTLLAFAELRAFGPGDVRRARLRERLVLDHTRYARHIAGLYSAPDKPDDAAFAAARAGLAAAVDAYDPESGLDFLAFATPLILREVRALRRAGSAAGHPPRRSRQLADALPATADRLARRLGRSPTISELAAALGVDVERVVESLDTALGYPAARTGLARRESDQAAEPGGRTGATGRTAEADAAPSFADTLSSEQIKTLLAPLSERNKRIVMMRYLRGMTDAQIGAEMNISPVHVCRLLAQAVNVLHIADPSVATGSISSRSTGSYSNPSPSQGPSPSPIARDAQNIQNGQPGPRTSCAEPAAPQPPPIPGPRLLTA